MTSKVNADNTLGGVILTGDSSGILELQAGGNTVLTLNDSRAVGVGASPDYGVAGQALISNGSASAPYWGAAGPSTGKSIVLSMVFGG